jgi:hypothetical protein
VSLCLSHVEEPVTLQSLDVPHSFKPIGKVLSQNSIRAMAAGENKDNLDHLQRFINLFFSFSFSFSFSLYRFVVLCLPLCKVVGPISNCKDGLADD